MSIKVVKDTLLCSTLSLPALANAKNTVEGSLLDATWGLILGILLALCIVAFWPVRTFIQKRRSSDNNSDDTGSNS